jgi:hypothetical protein
VRAKRFRLCLRLRLRFFRAPVFRSSGLLCCGCLLCLCWGCVGWLAGIGRVYVPVVSAGQLSCECFSCLCCYWAVLLLRGCCGLGEGMTVVGWLVCPHEGCPCPCERAREVSEPTLGFMARQSVSWPMPLRKERVSMVGFRGLRPWRPRSPPVPGTCCVISLLLTLPGNDMLLLERLIGFSVPGASVWVGTSLRVTAAWRLGWGLK